MLNLPDTTQVRLRKLVFYLHVFSVARQKNIFLLTYRRIYLKVNLSLH